MNRHGLKAIGLLVTVSLCGAAADTRSSAGSAPSMLTVAQDESSVEEAIATYLRSRGLVVGYVNASANQREEDRVLILPYGGPSEIPNFRILIDTQPSNRDPSSQTVTERVVFVRLLTGTYVKPGHESALLGCLNNYHQRFWAGRFFVDTDRELVADWPLNILASGLPAEVVHDAVLRLVNGWNFLYPFVKAHITTSGTAKEREETRSSQTEDARGVPVL